MARAGIVTERVAEAAGYPPTAVDRMLRDLREAKLAPVGTRGLGQVDGAYQESHLADLILAFAGPWTNDAAESARLLRPLIRLMSDGSPLPNPPDTLGDDLENMIRGFALGLDAPDTSEANELPRVIEISLTRLHAVATYTSGHQDFYVPDARLPDVAPGSRSRLRRGGGIEKVTHVFPELIAECGRLYHDTLQKAAHAASKKTAAPFGEGTAAIVAGTVQNEPASSPHKGKKEDVRLYTVAAGRR